MTGLPALPVLAQVSFGATGGNTTTTLVEEQSVLENLRSAFITQTGSLYVSSDLDVGQQEQARRVVRDAQRNFIHEARLTLNELKGDGVLAADEVTDAIGDLRDNYIEQVDRALQAIADGYPPPPVREPGMSGRDYASAMVSYTLQTRNDARDWLMVASAIGGGLLLAWLASLGLRRSASALRDKRHRWSAELTEALVGPVYMVLLALALRIGFDWLWIPGIADDWIGRTVNVVWIGALFWFIWRACEVIAHGLAWLIRKTYHAALDDHIVLVLSRALRVIALALFVLFIVNGVMDSDLTGLIAGLGVLGVVLSFLMRGTIENIAASFTIFGDKPFRVGDLVIYEERWGRIEDIGFRSTRFRTLDGHLITIPNSKLVDDAIHNVGARPSIRRRFRIGLTYDTPPEKIEQALSILRELLSDYEGKPENSDAHVVFESYGDYALNLLVQYYYEPASYWKALEFDSELNLEINRRFADADIAFAFPTQTLHLHDPDGAFADNAERQPSSEGMASDERTTSNESEAA
ncbi:MAG: mechanosensitive ion channel family protein [Gammaproteobacteria bacterium]|nr:mechanosensitive ion channel family protein [Gammaproteobacteria bacterium]